MMTVYITLKKVIIPKVSLENKTITKIKSTEKTLLKISCPVIVAIQQRNLVFTRYQLLCNGKIYTKKSRHFHTDISDEDRETINIKQQTENNPSFKIKKNIAAEAESENQDETAEQKPQSISVEKDEQSRRKIKGSSFPIVKCSECGLSIRSNNLKRHVRNKHSSSRYKPFVACVDKDLAI